MSTQTEPLRLACDTHTHTIFSRHAYSTIEENVRTAAERGIELLGSTDHFSDMLYLQRDIRNYQYYNNYRVWPREWHGVKLLHGAETDIVNLHGDLYGADDVFATSIDGTPVEPISMQDYVFRRCDYVVASVHNKWFARNATIEQATDMYVRALEHPKVLTLGHSGRSGIRYDIDTVLEAARVNHKLIEINEYSFTHVEKSHEMCLEILERCAETNTPIAVNTDSHISAEIGDFRYVPKLLEEMHFPRELIATRTAEAFLDALRAANIAPAEECEPIPGL